MSEIWLDHQGYLSMVLLHSLWQGALIFFIYRYISFDSDRQNVWQLYWPVPVMISGIVLTYYFLSGSEVASIGISTLPVIKTTSWSDYFLAFWFAGMMIQFTRFALEYYKVSLWRFRGHLIKEGVIYDQVVSLSEQLGLSKLPNLRIVRDITIPMVVGIARPVLLLPASLVTQLTPEELEGILLHELKHIQRYDYLWNLIISGLEVVLFFNPFIYFISREIRRRREISCDLSAAKISRNPKALASALLTIEEMVSTPKLAMAFNSQGQLSERVHVLMGMKKKKRSGSYLVSFLALAICLPFVLAFHSTKEKDSWSSYLYDIRYDSITVPGFHNAIHSLEFQTVAGEVKDVKINDAPVKLKEPEQVYALKDQLSAVSTDNNRQAEFETGLKEKYKEGRRKSRNPAEALEPAERGQGETLKEAENEIKYNLATIEGYRYGKSLDTLNKWHEWTFPDKELEIEQDTDVDDQKTYFLKIPGKADRKGNYEVIVKYDGIDKGSHRTESGYSSEYIENEIEQMLIDHGLIKYKYSYSLELTDDRLIVNGERQSVKMHRLFKARYVDMSRKNPSSKFNYQILKNQIR
ncbi:MAG: M56 family metallopeptidase [Saprospiraceae bacterium]|nr:M56 family metallopeptidase [Saprospiraceae bacterium]